MISPLPYLGMKRGPEFHCWDLARLIYQKEFGIELNAHCVNLAESAKECAKASQEEIANPVWEQSPIPEPNGLVLLGRKGLRYHVGFMLTRSMVLHLLDGAGVVVQSLADVRKPFDNITFFRHVEIHPS